MAERRFCSVGQQHLLTSQSLINSPAIQMPSQSQKVDSSLVSPPTLMWWSFSRCSSLVVLGLPQIPTRLKSGFSAKILWFRGSVVPDVSPILIKQHGCLKHERDERGSSKLNGLIKDPVIKQRLPTTRRSADALLGDVCLSHYWWWHLLIKAMGSWRLQAGCTCQSAHVTLLVLTCASPVTLSLAHHC